MKFYDWPHIIKSKWRYLKLSYFWDDCWQRHANSPVNWFSSRCSLHICPTNYLKRPYFQLGPHFPLDACWITPLSPFVVAFPGCQLYDFGDLNFTQVPNDELYNNLIYYPRSVGLASQVLADAVSRAVAAGHSCVTIGGDHRYAHKLEAICVACLHANT